MKRQTIRIICAIVLLTIVVVGSTYAFFLASVSGNRNINTNSSNFEVIYTGGTSISGEMPITYNKTNAFKTTINIRMGQNSVLAKSTIYISIDEISQNLRIPGFIWEVYRIVNSEEVYQNSGNFNGYNDTTNNIVNIVSNYQLSRENTSFVVYLWIDGSQTNNNVLGSTFSGHIGAVTENFAGEL